MTTSEKDFGERPVQPIGETEEDLCRMLWASVAIQAFADARSESGREESRRRRAEALAWLSAAEEDRSEFAMVCELAGLDFEETRRRFKELLHQKGAALDFRALARTTFAASGPEPRGRYLRRSSKRSRLKRLIRKLPGLRSHGRMEFPDSEHPGLAEGSPNGACTERGDTRGW